MKRILLLIPLLALVQLVDAQPAEPSGYVEKPKKVKMPKYFVAGFPKKSIPVTTIQIRQTVWDSTRLGFLEKGMFNMKTEAVPADNLTEFLQEYVTKQYKEGYKKTGNTLLIVVNELRINERTMFSSDNAFTKIGADAWIAADGISFRHVASIDSVLLYTGMVDVTSEHGTNIAKGLYHLVLTALKNAQAGDYINPLMVTEEEIISKAREGSRSPILTASTYKEGAYMSFAEFLQNAPSVSSFETIVVDKKKIKIEMMEAGVRKEIIPWGICKGGDIYKYYEQSLVPIEKNNDGFIISDYIEKSRRRNSGIYMGAILGGAIGAGIASGTAKKMYLVPEIPYLKKKQPEACAIDMETGEFTF